MNDKLKSLCEKAKDYALEKTKNFNGDEPVTEMDFFVEKFSELIINESIKVMIRHDYHGKWLGEIIKQHFGKSLGEF